MATADINAAEIRRRIAAGTNRLASAPDLAFRDGRIVPVNGGGGRPSGGSYNAAFTDPALLAYLRAMGVQEEGIRTGVRQQTRDAVRAWEVQEPLYRENLDAARENISTDWESRGLYRSGATLGSLAGAARDAMRQYLGDRQAVTDAVSGYQRAGASAITRLRQEAIEQELNARRAATERAAQSAYGRGGKFY